MSVSDKITQLINDISSSYQKIQSKGGTIPSSKNTNNLPDAIDSIPIGSDPVITPIEITENGTYTASEGVDGYSPINVNVPSTTLPVLTNPASTSDILAGKEAIDGEGNKITGTMEEVIDWLPYAQSIQLAFTNTNFPLEDITMHLESVTSTGLYQAFRGASGVINLTLYVGEGITTLSRLADLSASIERITIIGNLSTVTTYNSMIRAASIKELDADIDFSSVTTAAGAFNINICTNLTTVRFVPNTLSVSIKFGSKVFTDETLVSYANTLKTGTTGTVTWSSESKSRAEAILGTVSQVTEGDETYDFFTADEYGDTTLTQFITLTKGWTLA